MSEVPTSVDWDRNLHIFHECLRCEEPLRIHGIVRGIPHDAKKAFNADTTVETFEL